MSAALPRIYADFNGIGLSPRTPGRLAVRVDTQGSRDDLAAAGLELRDGLRLLVFDWSDETEDIEGEATVYFVAEPDLWIAEFDEPAYRYVPRGDRPPGAPYGTRRAGG